MYVSAATATCAGSAGQQEVQELLQGSTGSAEDKLRLAILFLLLSEKLPADSELESMQTALQNEGADVEAFKYVLRMRQMNLTGHSMVSGAGHSGSKSQASLLGLVDSSIMSGIAGQFGKQLTKLVGGSRQVCELHNLDMSLHAKAPFWYWKLRILRFLAEPKACEHSSCSQFRRDILPKV